MAKKNKKILIVEDDKDFASILQIKFTSEGFSVVIAENGEDGIIAADKEKPDLILSDVLMPQMSGLEMAKKIREAGKNTVIMFLTNITDVDSAANKEKLGEFEYLIKSQWGIGDIVDKIKIKLGLK